MNFYANRFLALNSKIVFLWLVFKNNVEMQKITKEVYLKWYEDMLFWRKFEDKLAAVYIQQKVRGFLHLI